MNTRARHDQFRVQFWSGFHGTTWASYGREQGSFCSSVRNPSVRADLSVGRCAIQVRMAQADSANSEPDRGVRPDRIRSTILLPDGRRLRRPGLPTSRICLLLAIPAWASAVLFQGLTRGLPRNASLSDNTRQAYAGALGRLDAWLDGRQIDDAALAAYLAELHDADRAASSAAMAVAAARFRARLAGQADPAGARTARVLAGYRRTAGDRGRGQARPFSAKVFCTPNTSTGKR